jgi:hypothetical protein
MEMGAKGKEDGFRAYAKGYLVMYIYAALKADSNTNHNNFTMLQAPHLPSQVAPPTA